MSPSDARRPDAGFSLLETLVALAILAAVTGVAAAALRGPSPTLRLDAAVTALMREATAARHRAVVEGRTVPLPLPRCDGAETVARFHPDGTASGAASACLALAGLTRELRLSPLSGRLLEVAPE